jgi:hypothetical protein
VIIGLSGFARAGKDEAAKVLVEEFGFVRIGFADKLREVIYQLNPFIVSNYSEWGMMPEVDGFDSLQRVIDRDGWDGYKEGPYSDDIRRLLQRLGTEAGRQTLWDSIWIDAAFAEFSETDNVVVSDARFTNEFDAIRERGGAIWRIDRPGVGPANNHSSELEAIDYPHFSERITNSGSLEDYRESVINAYKYGD